MLGGSNGGDTAIVSRTFGGIETSSSKVVISMSSIFSIVAGTVMDCASGGVGFLGVEPFSHPRRDAYPSALVIVEWLLCPKSVLGVNGIRCSSRVESKAAISWPALFQRVIMQTILIPM
jgi:hypothetical protein